MDILMVSPELSPYARASRAGDSVLALAKALSQLEHAVTIAVPAYPGFESGGLLAARRLTPLKLPNGGSITVLDAQLPNGATVVLLDAPSMFERPYVSDDTRVSGSDVERFALLCQATVALVRQQAERGQPFDVVHLHDWPAAGAAALLRSEPQRPAVVLTLHDGSRLGMMPAEALSSFGIPDSSGYDACREGALVGLAAVGASAADAVTALSPTIGGDWQDESHFGLLSRTLAATKVPVTGILNGLDYSVWNPATDPALKSRYDAEAPANKGSSKTDLLRRVGLSLDLARPLLVTLLDAREDVATRLLLDSVPQILRNDLALVIAGNAVTLEPFTALADEHRNACALETATDDAALRRACAAADLVLLPHPYERTALWARAVQRYGAIPVARATGAHADAIVDCDTALETGTGFLFDEPTREGILGALGRALAAYQSPVWPSLRRRAMRLDLSWDRAARRYVQVFRQASAGKSRPRTA